MTCPQSADPPGPHNLPASFTSSPRVRSAAITGALTVRRVEAIDAALAQQPGVNPVTLLTRSELHHVLFIQQTLGATATVADVFAVVRALGRP